MNENLGDVKSEISEGAGAQEIQAMAFRQNQEGANIDEPVLYQTKTKNGSSNILGIRQGFTSRNPSAISPQRVNIFLRGCVELSMQPSAFGEEGIPWEGFQVPILFRGKEPIGLFCVGEAAPFLS